VQHGPTNPPWEIPLLPALEVALPMVYELDVRTADPETEVERPASPEPNRKSKESNRKSHEQLPVLPTPYTVTATTFFHQLPGGSSGNRILGPSEKSIPWNR